MTNLHETDRLVERLDGAQYESVHRAAIDAYEAATPADCRYSAVALRKAVDAAFRALTAMGGKAEPVGFGLADGQLRPVDRGPPDGRYALAFAAHAETINGDRMLPLSASPVQARTGEVTVKPLKWEYNDFQSIWRAPSILGDWRAWDINGWCIASPNERIGRIVKGDGRDVANDEYVALVCSALSSNESNKQ